MSVLPLIIVLLIVLDKYCFSHILQRPLVACTLLGASLGYLKEGMLLGGALEVYYIAYQSLSEYVPVESGFLFTSIISSFLVSGGVDASITNASAFLVAGIALEYVLNLFNTLFLPAVRKACEKHDDKKVGMMQLALMLINALVYVGVAYFMMNNASSINATLSTIIYTYPFVMIGIMTIASLMPCIAFAILLRNMGGKDLTGAVLLGVAVGLILVSMTSTAVSGTIVACIAFALGWFHFRSSQKETVTVKKEESKPVNTIKGGAEKWW